MLALFVVVQVTMVTPVVAQEPTYCFPSCDSATYGHSYETISLPGFPGCSITYLVAWQLCPNGTMTLSFPKVYWATPSVPCSTYVAALFSGTGGSINWDFVTWVFDEGFHVIAQKWFDQAYAGGPPPYKYLYECPNHGPVTYQGSYESCVDWVYIDDPAHQVTRVEKQPCSTQLCCLLQTTFCYNTTTHTDEETDTWVQTQNPAPDCSSDIVPLPSGALFHSGCRAFCGSTALTH